MRLFDTHAHLDLPPEATPSARRFAVERAKSAGIQDILIPGVSPSTWSRLQDIAHTLRENVRLVRIHTSVGIHPFWIRDLQTRDKGAISTLLHAALDNAPPGVVAIGECGLDFGPRGRAIARADQLAVLDAHLDVARARALPLLLHCVKAHRPMIERLRHAPPSILHSFSGSAELLQQYCRFGHFISFAGSVTRPTARKAIAAVRATPEDRLLFETDSPDQLPFTRRPDASTNNAQIIRNEPAFLVDIVCAAAQLRGVDTAALAELASANAIRVLALEESSAAPTANHSPVLADRRARERDL
jgi:TatD DNase family protein